MHMHLHWYICIKLSHALHSYFALTLASCVCFLAGTGDGTCTAMSSVCSSSSCSSSSSADSNLAPRSCRIFLSNADCLLCSIRIASIASRVNVVAVDKKDEEVLVEAGAEDDAEDVEELVEEDSDFEDVEEAEG